MDHNRALDNECEQLTSGGQNAADKSSGGDRSNGIVVTPPLPKGCVPLTHQVAGHIYGKSSSKAGLLQDGTGTVLKPSQNACRGERERTFYQNISRADQTDPLYLSLRPLVPVFYGAFVAEEDPSLVYLKIKDITTQFRKPCVMDVKIGCKSYEDGVPERKVQLAKEKYPNLAKIGFQILGMRVYHPSTDEFEYRDKFYGRKLQGDNVIEGFARYLNVVDSVRTDVIPVFLREIRRIEDWFSNQRRLHFYSSSLLFVYEGDVKLPLSPPATVAPAGSSDNDALNGSPPNFVSYSQLKKAGPKVKHSPNPASSLPTDANGQVQTPPDENGFVNRLPTYQESIAAKLGYGPSDGQVHSGAEGESCSNGGSAQPQLLDINGRLTVSQMRERQRSQSQSNAQSDLLSSPKTDKEQPIASASNGADKPEALAQSPGIVKETNDVTEPDGSLAIVKMIDFTHVVDANGADESYLFGLRNVIRYFEMLKDAYCEK